MMMALKGYIDPMPIGNPTDRIREVAPYIDCRGADKRFFVGECKALFVRLNFVSAMLYRWLPIAWQRIG